MKRIGSTVLILACISLGSTPGRAAWPDHIVLTNDDGIDEEERLLPMARALATIADVTVVVPQLDRSGSTNYMSLGARQRSIEVERILEQPATDDRGAITILAVSGFPADCVALALGGLFEQPPDLVVSGPNGGANLGGGWIGSGTVGAARMAAFLGLPAVAISGVEDDWPEALAAVSAWTTKLVQTSLVRDLEPGQYLTVGLPQKMPGEIRGVRVASRAGLSFTPRFKKVAQPLGRGDRGGTIEVWAATGFGPPPQKAPGGSDVPLVRDNYIVVTPMRVDEIDYPALERLRASYATELPAWP